MYSLLNLGSQKSQQYYLERSFQKQIQSFRQQLLCSTLMSGWTQQFVCPYMVSGLSVAAIRKTFFPVSALHGIREERKSSSQERKNM